MTEHQSPLTGTYDWHFVVLSIGIASIAAYVALTLSERVTESRGRWRYLWLFGGATLLGGGIWAMHFTGMLAFQLPVVVMYDLPVVGLSLVAAIIASAIALLVVSRPQMSRGSWLCGGILMGTGIAAMHYLGMAAMRMSASTHWHPGIVALSLAVAIAVSLVALKFAFRLRSVSRARSAWHRVGAAGIMGVAVAGMHYTGMAAAAFRLEPNGIAHGSLIGRGTMVGCVILISTVLMLVFVLVTSTVQRRLSDQSAALVQHQRYFRTIVANAPVILIALDANGVILFAEGRDLSGLGYPAETLIGEPFADLFSHLPTLVEHARRALAGETHAADAEIAGIIFDVRWTPLLDSGGAVTSVIAVATDITERRTAELALRNRSLRDPLTNLPNRTALTERLAELLETSRIDGRPFALAFIDLDRFKEVNDTLGHDVGDALLQSVAERIDRALTAMGIRDGAVRLGGDEFAMLLPEQDEAGATAIAKQVLRDFTTPHSAAGYSLDVRASFGLAIYPTHGTDEQTLLRCADVAMYVAKRGRLGYAVYDATQDRHSKALLALEADMRQAIAQGGFTLHYQPQVDMVSGRISAVEALIRWHHPTLGSLMPDAFIPLAEDTGLIVPLTHWVLGEALRQVGAWRAQGLVLTVAVNVSMRGLREVALPDMVEYFLHRYAVPAERLVIEVTESVIMADDQQTREVFAHLARLGVVLSIDDFGTGYSSLAYLRELPVSELKIDKSFVIGLAQGDSKGAELVRLIVDLGHNLGLRIIAEGVENEAVFAFLADLGCDVAQGYFISRPIPADQLRALIAATEPTQPSEVFDDAIGVTNSRERSPQLRS